MIDANTITLNGFIKGEDGLWYGLGVGPYTSKELLQRVRVPGSLNILKESDYFESPKFPKD